MLIGIGTMTVVALILFANVSDSIGRLATFAMWAGSLAVMGGLV